MISDLLKPEAIWPQPEVDQIRLVCRSWLSVALLSTSLLGNAADDEEYLRTIELETEKIGTATRFEGNPATGAQVGGKRSQQRGERAVLGESMEGFERMLRQEYAGTAVFYRKLSPRSQEEIYEQYLSDIPVSELRQKIMDRYLNR